MNIDRSLLCTVPLLVAIAIGGCNGSGAYDVNTRYANAERAAKVYKGLTPLGPDDIADAVAWCATRPLHVNVSEVVVMPTAQASTTLVHRT